MSGLKSFASKLSGWILATQVGRLIGHIWHHDIITIDIDVHHDRYDERLAYSRISKATAISMGYTRGSGMTDRLAHSLFPVYVKFHNLPDLGSEEGVLETSETLFDAWNSSATSDFISGITSKPQLLPDNKKLFMIAVGAVIAVAAIYVLFVA